MLLRELTPQDRRRQWRGAGTSPGSEASPVTRCWTPASPGAGQVLTLPPRERLVPSHKTLEPLSSSRWLRARPSPPQDTPWPGSQQARGCPSAPRTRPLWGRRGGPAGPSPDAQIRPLPRWTALGEVPRSQPGAGASRAGVRGDSQAAGADSGPRRRFRRRVTWEGSFWGQGAGGGGWVPSWRKRLERA